MEVLQADGVKSERDVEYKANMTVVTVEASGTGSKQDQNLRLLLVI